jgi:uncharacterized protein
MADLDYATGIQSWRDSLETDIRREDGPLALVALFWVQDGINTVGSSPDCTFCLPKPAPRLIGAFDFDGRQLQFRADIGQVAEIDGAVAHPGVTVKLRTGTSPSRLRIGELTMVPVELGGRLGIRAWDRSRPALASRPVRAWFDPDPRFLIRATYTPYPAPVKISMPDSLGGIHSGYAQGYISFKLDGKSHNLDATETDDGRLFLQFRDHTNGARTYAEGRFLHSDTVSEDGTVTIDFNRAFNPLAAFTTLMPSAVPPKNHSLKCTVEAGERTPAIPPEWKWHV